MEFPVMSSQAGGFSLSLSECASEVLLENFQGNSNHRGTASNNDFGVCTS